MKTLLLFLFLTPSFSFATPPTVKLTVDEAADKACAQQTKSNIQSEWTTELKTRLPEFQKEWDQSGPKLLQTAEEITGKKFAGSTATAHLSLCSPSGNTPLTINMRHSLKSFISEPISPAARVGNEFHEVLHSLVDSLVPAKSPLLAKFSNENADVRKHLHLLSLQKAVYLKLKKKDDLQKVVQLDRASPNKAYERAWEIVNKNDTYQEFVKELKER